ncbi:MAG: ribosome biogenesis GTPase Der [Desulfobacteraceae bacterium]|nr:ribosome biogenesis GTPase Der [Desulfobacteraceae bacterium]
MKPIVAIIGRPNVGKSTLFNRITRKRDALVDDRPGVTRDRHYCDAAWDGRELIVVDTGGFISGDADDFAPHIRFQVEQAVEQSDAVVLMLDGKYGLSPFDRDLIDWLRRIQQPVFFVINKIDGPEKEDRLYDFYSLGLSTLYSLSAEHGYGVRDFMDALVAGLSFGTGADTAQDAIRVAFVGRPNAGKSSMVNKLLGEQRLVVTDKPGTTVDTLDVLYERQGRTYQLIDTAGIRRKSKVSAKLEKFSVIKALKGLERCDVALIILDAEQGLTEQDVRIAGYAHDRGCGTIWVANKWDLMKKTGITPYRFERNIKETARYLAYAPVLTVSALTGRNLNKLFPMINHIYDQYATRITTGQINRIINQATGQNEPSLHKGRRLKFYYTTQVSTQPPTFVSFVNYPDAVHFSYQRYLLNQIRSQSKLEQVPVRLLFRQRTGKLSFPKKSKKKRQK